MMADPELPPSTEIDVKSPVMLASCCKTDDEEMSSPLVVVAEYVRSPPLACTA